MENLIEFMFNANRFVQRGHCGEWDNTFKVIYIMSNLAIFAAYFCIPILLIKWDFIFKNLIKSTRLKIGFIAFILSCGTGHIEGALSFWCPLYHMFALWHLFTAIISWMTLFIFWLERENNVVGN